MSEASNLAFSLGSLTVLAFDGGLDQRALDEVAKRNKEERCLKHMERILQEKSGLESDEAQKRMEPFHLLQKLRNGHLPFHNPNEDGKKAFASIGHPLPVQNPSVCWDAICDLYVKALDAITDALAQSLTKPNDSIANEVVSDAN